MIKILEFFVPGVPATAGSKTAFPIYKGKGFAKKFTGHVAMVPASKRQKPWMALVASIASEAKDWDGLILRGPVFLEIVFQFCRPKAHFGTGKNADKLKPSAPEYMTKTPDLTKLTRAIEDALTEVIWANDSQVVSQRTDKIYNPTPGACVYIYVMTPGLPQVKR